MSNKITYRQQYTRCGKDRCRKCREGEGHGPYWYAYWSEKGRTVSKYIGVQLPADVAVEVNQQVQEIGVKVKAPEESASEITFSDTPHTIAPSLPELRVYLLGQFHVERKSEQGWSVIDHRTWQRRRVRSLLGCLLNSPGRRLGREQAMELLWPDLDVDISANRLNGAVHELRQILEPNLARPAASRLLRLEHDVLELADNFHIWVDVDAFENLLKEAELLIAIHPMQAEYLFEEAAALYSGGYLLEELYAEWAAPRRDALQRRWVGTLLDLAHMRTQRGAFASAIETLDRLRVADPTNETALQRLMVLLTHVDRRGEALHIYRQHVATLQREHESAPLAETRQLYEALHAGESSEVYLSKWVQSRPKGQEQTTLRTKLAHTSSHPTSTSNTTSRLAFQSGRHNQSPLVGRDQELYTMQTVLQALEQRTERPLESEQKEGRLSLDTIPLTGSGRPHLLLLMGEPGLGKTRLAEELSSDAHEKDWTVIWSRVHEQDGNVPYHPWRGILRTLLPDIADTLRSPREMFVVPGLPAFQLEWLHPLLPEIGITPTLEHAVQSYEQERLHLWEATLGLLSMLSRQHPLLIVVDDLHWADESSVELLTYLAHHLQNQRILLVGTCRDDELAPSHKLRTLVAALLRVQAVVTLAVKPLTHDQIGTLVAHLPQEMVAQIQTQAAGNPLFAEELARYVSSQNSESPHASTVLREDTQGYTHPSMTRKLGRDALSPLPEVVTALLERRLHRLSTECQTLLGKAAVLGGSFELRQLLLMTPEHTEDITLDLLEEALQEGLLIEEGTGSQIMYHFWHPLIVSHLYERLSAARRAQMHRRAAGVIEATSTPLSHEKVASTIVYHLLRGGSDASQILYYAEIAGHQARALTAYAEAHYYYLKAIHAFSSLLRASYDFETDDIVASLEHITSTFSTQQAPDASAKYDLTRICRLLEHMAECDRILGFFEDERKLYECILAIRISPTFQQQLSTTQIESLTNRTKFVQYEAQFQALLWREMSTTWVAVGDYDQAYVCCERGREVMQSAGVTDGAAWAALSLQISVILRYKGNYHEARSYVQEALTILEHTNATDQIQHTQLSSDTYISQQFLASSPQTRIERTLNNDPSHIGRAQEVLGIIDASEGRVSDALLHMHTALHLYEEQELVSEVIITCGNLGAVYIMRGDLDAARSFLYRARELAERVGDKPNLAFITGNLGDIAYRSGNLHEAEKWYTRSLILAEQFHDREHISWCCVVLANVQQDQGKLYEAAQHLYRAIVTGRAIKNSRCIRFALVSLGDLRILEAIIIREYQRAYRTDNEQNQQDERLFRRLLQRAKSTLQRAISQEEVEKESIIDCKLLLATVHYLLGQFQKAQHMALQTLQEAQEQETSRAIGRTQCLLGRILAARQRYDEADNAFEQAIAHFHKQGLRLDYARAILSYGITLLQRSWLPDFEDEQQKLLQDSLRYLRVAHGLFDDAHATIDAACAEHLLAHYAMPLTETTC